MKCLVPYRSLRIISVLLVEQTENWHDSAFFDNLTSSSTIALRFIRMFDIKYLLRISELLLLWFYGQFPLDLSSHNVYKAISCSDFLHLARSWKGSVGKQIIYCQNTSDIMICVTIASRWYLPFLVVSLKLVLQKLFKNYMCFIFTAFQAVNVCFTLLFCFFQLFEDVHFWYFIANQPKDNVDNDLYFKQPQNQKVTGIQIKD